MEKHEISVGGMACGHCEIAVQDAVRRLPGIKKVKASKRKKNCRSGIRPGTGVPCRH